MDLTRNHYTASASPLARLQRFARPKEVFEKCDLCGQAIPAEHPHLLELSGRKMHCACSACGILFSGDEGTRFRRVPRRILRLDGFVLDDVAWESLGIPINLAFFYRSALEDRTIAMYPSPAGPTESQLSMEAWTDLAASNPVLAAMESDVEALLIYRISPRRDCYLVPIDQCYKLVGLIRSNWRGLSGGAEVWREIARFFESLSQQASPAAGTAHA